MPSIASNEFKDGEDFITFSGKYMEVYIPEFYFEKSISELIGDHFRTMGILNFKTFKDIDGKQPNELKVFNIPTEIYTYPSGGYEVKELDLVGRGASKYTILKYYNGDRFCHKKVASTSKSFVVVLKALLQGKLPPTIPYDIVYDIWDKSFEANNVSMDIPDIMKEMVVAQIYRDPKDMSRTFGQALAKNPKLSMTSYETANPRQLTISHSNFTGLIFEDAEQMLVSGINNTKEGKHEASSPMEQVMKY